MGIKKHVLLSCDSEGCSEADLIEVATVKAALNHNRGRNYLVHQEGGKRQVRCGNCHRQYHEHGAFSPLKED